VELLESRDVPSTFNLTPLVQVSGPSPFLGNPVESNDPPGTTNLEFEPYVAVDTTNSNHLVGAWIQDLNRGIVAGVSFNGGNTWQSVVIPGISLSSGGIYPYSFDPWVSFAPNGDVYVSACGTEVQGDFSKAVLVSKSTDGGLTWGTPASFVAGKNDFYDKASITADPTNAQFVYAVWTGLHGGGGTTLFSRSADGGKTWESPRVIFDPGSNADSRSSQIVVLPDGTLVNTFVQQVHKNDSGKIEHQAWNLSVIHSTDHGQTWLPVTSSGPEILPIDDTQTVPVPNPDGGLSIHALNWVFDVAVDPANDNLYAVWSDARFSKFQYNSIAFSMSTDGGLTWSTPIKINQTPDNIPVGNRQAFLPSIAVNQDGVVAVTYYDFRNNTPAPGLPTDVWMVHAHPADGLTNPASWSSENRLTPASFNMEIPAPRPDGYFVGDYQGLVGMGKHFGAFWAMPPGASPSLTDQSSIFFRDPLPAESATESVSHDRSAELSRAVAAASNPPSVAAAATANWNLFAFPLALSAAHDQPATMSLRTMDGSAKTSDDEFVAKSSTLTFAPGVTTKTITIEVKGDSKREADETFYLDLFGEPLRSGLTET
jgi:hypothetical protein